MREVIQQFTVSLQFALLHESHDAWNFDADYVVLHETASKKLSHQNIHINTLTGNECENKK